MPVIYAGEPAAADKSGYRVAEIGPVSIFYPPNLRVRPGHAAIRISRKNLLWWQWLELAGARSIPVIQQ